jgi:biofilm protein TabA
MIVTDIEHARNQMPQTQSFQQAIRFLERQDLATLPDGTIEIDGRRVYASVQSYDTLPIDAPFRFEAHREYIDVQYMVGGEETIEWAPAIGIAFEGTYDATGDIQFGTVAGTTTPVRLERGQLAVLFPSDGHAPRHTTRAPGRVKKIVIKIAVGG